MSIAFSLPSSLIYFLYFLSWISDWSRWIHSLCSAALQAGAVELVHSAERRLAELTDAEKKRGAALFERCQSHCHASRISTATLLAGTSELMDARPQQSQAQAHGYRHQQHQRGILFTCPAAGGSANKGSWKPDNLWRGFTAAVCVCGSIYLSTI